MNPPAELGQRLEPHSAALKSDSRERPAPSIAAWALKRSFGSGGNNAPRALPCALWAFNLPPFHPCPFCVASHLPLSPA
jgi:hypothetical protein